jgi:hypothetical protein
MTNKISKEYNNNKCGNVNCGNKPLSDSKLSPCELLSKDEQLLDTNYKLLSNELSFNSQSLLDNNPSSDKVLLGNNYLSNTKILSSKELNLSKYKLVLTNKDNRVSKDDKDYKDLAFNIGSQQLEPNNKLVGTAAVFRPG